MSKNNSIKIACSGGAGFVGSNVIKYLNNQGYTNIDVYDKLDSLHKKIHNIFPLNINGLYDYKTLPSLVQNYDWIVHIGADSATKTLPENYENVLNQNFYYTKNLLSKWSNNKFYNPSSKFIFASSASVYGNTNDFTERLDCQPQHLYGLTKLLCDREIQKQIDLGIKGLYSFRFFNVIGFNEKHKIEKDMASPISRFLLQDPPFILYRDEQNTEFKRDFIHVSDVASVVHHALTYDVPSCICNLGSGVGTTWEDLVKIVCEVRGLDFNNSIRYEPLPDSIKRQYQAITVANLDVLRKTLRYKKDFMNIKDAVVDIYNNILK